MTRHDRGGRAMAMGIWARAALVVALLVASPLDDARASAFDTYGFSSRAIAMGNAQAATGIHYDAAYYNVANILVRKRTHLGVGLNLVAPSLRFDAVEGRYSPLMPETQTAFHLGFSTPIGGVLSDRVGFGLAFFHPLSSGTRVASVDPETPAFYRYQDLPDKLIVAAGFAAEPVDWLRIGVGAQLLAEFGGDVTASLSLAEGRFLRERIDVELLATLSPTAGLSLGPFEGVRVGLAYRHELELRYALPVRVTIEEIGELAVDVRGISLFTPSQLALGVSWESAPAPAPGVQFEAGFTWEKWSDAPPAGAYFALSIDDSRLREPGAEPEDLIAAVASPTPLGARDTLTPRVGAEWRPDRVWTVRAGWFWRPTPLPRPIHRTNMLDAGAHVFSVGGGATFGDPTGVASAPVHIDVALQLSRLSKRAIAKAPGGSPPGSYTFGGLIWHVTLDLRHDFE